MAFDAADYLVGGGDPEAALSSSTPMGSLAYRHSADLSRARATVKAAVLALGAAQTTNAERNAVARSLGEALDALAWLAVLAPEEWERACLTFTHAGGFVSRVAALRKAMREAVGRNESERNAEQEREAQAHRTVEPDPFDIRAALSRTEKGHIKPTYANIVTILKRDPYWKTLRMSDLGNVTEISGKELVEATATATACEWLRDAYAMDANEVSVKSAIYAVAEERRYSPVREYLERVRPLRQHRTPVNIEAILPDILGILHPTLLHVEMVKRFLVSAVARAMRPGCKVDTAFVLIGGQGAKKSTFFATLFGEFFADSPIPIGNKDAPINMSRVWGYEAAELEDLTSKRTAESVKQFMASSSDLYRPPFARVAIQVPRHTVLCGSANPRDILTDPTGSRRFWILSVPNEWVVPIPLLQKQRDVIWSEALDLYGNGSGDGVNGHPWWFDRDADKERERDALQYAIVDDWQPLVELWLMSAPPRAFVGGEPTGPILPPPGTSENFTRTALLLGIGLLPSQIDRKASVRAAAILTRLGWTEVNSPARFHGARVWQNTHKLSS